MSKTNKTQIARAAEGPRSTAGSVTTHQVTVERRDEYVGAIPPPSLLREFDLLIPGTAAKLIKWAEDEQLHRRALEQGAQTANIETQQRQVSIAEYQARAVFRSDLLGQTLGFIVCAGCAVGATWLGLTGNTGAAVALAAIPTAAVIQAFRASIFGKKSS